MKIRWHLLTVLIFTQISWAKGSPDLLPAKATDLHPTQASVGMESVRIKAELFRKMNHSTRKNFLQKHPVPVIVGPDQKFHLIDHHHMGRALIEAGHRNLFVTIVHDWSQKSKSEFWSDMETNGYTYLRDTADNKITPDELPETLNLLQDDPYRSLAYFAREDGAFNKVAVPFEEFFWASFYRKNIQPGELSHWKTAIKKAVRLSKSPEACHLPGFKGPKPCAQE